MQGKEPLDFFLDLAIGEVLETEFWIAPADTTQVGSSADESGGSFEEQLNGPYANISVSDGGAHTRFTVLSQWPAVAPIHNENNGFRFIKKSEAILPLREGWPP